MKRLIIALSLYVFSVGTGMAESVVSVQTADGTITNIEDGAFKVYTGNDPITSEITVYAGISDRDSERLADITEEYAGYPLSFLVCGKEMMKIRIPMRIEAYGMQFSNNLTEDSAAALARQLQQNTCE